MVLIEKGKPLWITFALLILSSNFFLYNSAVGMKILSAEPNGVVLGSILDFLITAPLFIWLTLKRKSLKTAILLSAFGCIAVRLIIPNQLLQPFETITWAGLAIEGIVIAIELLLITTLIRFLPKIVSQVRTSTKPILFSFSDAVNHYVPKNVIIQMLCSELIMLYYAVFAWRKKPEVGFTLYKNTSHIPFMIMIIHAIILETLAFHWWLHEKLFISSIVLLVFNVYSVLFFIADMFALRLNPTQIRDGHLYLSMGLMKRSTIKLNNIAAISQNKEELEAKIDEQTASFIVKEFQEGLPQLILYMKVPTTVTLMMGFEKQYSKIAIQCDQPKELIKKINEELAQGF
jgi:hypothetical protein